MYAVISMDGRSGRSEQREQKWRRQGRSSYGEQLDANSYEDGVSGARQRTKRHAARPFVKPGASMTQEALMDAVLDAAGVEGKYAHDARDPALWGKGDVVRLFIGARAVNAEVLKSFALFERIRYQLVIDTEGVRAIMGLTQAQMLALRKQQVELSARATAWVEALLDIDPLDEVQEAPVMSHGDYLDMLDLKRGSRRADIRRKRERAMKASAAHWI